MAESLEVQFARSIKNSMDIVLSEELEVLKNSFSSKHGFRGRTENSMKFQVKELQNSTSFMLRSRRVRSQSGELVDLILLLNEGTVPYFSPTDKLRAWIRQKLQVTKLSDVRRSAYAVSKTHSVVGNPVPANRGWFDQSFKESNLIRKIENQISRDLITFDPIL